MGRELENARRHVYLAIETLRPRTCTCTNMPSSRCNVPYAKMRHVACKFHVLVHSFIKTKFQKTRIKEAKTNSLPNLFYKQMPSSLCKKCRLKWMVPMSKLILDDLMQKCNNTLKVQDREQLRHMDHP